MLWRYATSPCLRRCIKVHHNVPSRRLLGDFPSLESKLQRKDDVEGDEHVPQQTRESNHDTQLVSPSSGYGMISKVDIPINKRVRTGGRVEDEHEFEQPGHSLMDIIDQMPVKDLPMGDPSTKEPVLKKPDRAGETDSERPAKHRPKEGEAAKMKLSRGQLRKGAKHFRMFPQNLQEDVEVASSKQEETDKPLPSLEPKNIFERKGVQPGTEVKLSGLVRSIRKHKKVAFATVSEGSTYEAVQAVLTPKDAESIQNGAYVSLHGVWQESKGSGQSNELSVTEVTFVGPSDPLISPIQKKSMSVDHLRAYPHLRIRTPLYALLARARAQVIASIHEFYSQPSRQEDPETHTNNPTYVQPPLITSSDCEGAGETFTVSPKIASSASIADKQIEPSHYFRTQKYLTVSSQLHLEAFSAELGNVWTLSPTFRAEESDTARHLSEFWMLEMEGRDVQNLPRLMAFNRRLIRHILNSFTSHPISKELLAHYADASHRPVDNPNLDLEARWQALRTLPKYLAYSDAIKLLQRAAAESPDLFKHPPSWDAGLQLEHERWITEHYGKNMHSVYVMFYPKKLKPFYMLDYKGVLDPEKPTHDAVVQCFDLLLPFGTCEVAGGSLREHDLERLITNMREKGMLKPSQAPPTVSENADGQTKEELYPFLQPGESLNTLQWYADLRRFGTSQHGGFGLGLDRLLMYLTGVSNVRDIVPFPRTYGVAHC